MTELFDAHCHIDVMVKPPAGGTAENTAACGRLLCGVGPSDWDAVADAAAIWAGTVPAFGLHPWHTGEGSGAWLDDLETRLLQHPDAWLGEAGLDGGRPGIATPAEQDSVFRAQLRLAKKLGRPVNLHCVKAWEPLLAALDGEYLTDGPRPFIVHSFGGPHQYIRPLEDRGAYFTVGPLSWRRESTRQRRRAALLPEGRLLVESDAFLAPARDAVDELRATLAWLADSRQSDVSVLARRVGANSRRLFDYDD